MSKKTACFIKSAAFTSSVCFLFMTFFYIGMLAFADNSAAEFPRYVFMRYFLGKLLCIFLFSLCMGFINRIFSVTRVNHAILRLIHFVSSFAAFVLTMIVLQFSMFSEDTLTTQNTLTFISLFVVGYFAVLGITAIGRRIIAE